jgi:RNA-directed DNA polymerase
VRKKHRKFKGGMRKLMKKYFKGVQRTKTYRNNWTFFGKVGGKDVLITDIQQIKVRSENVLPFNEDMNPYNPDAYDKFMTRNRSAIVKDITNNKQKRSLLEKQNAICPLCEGWIDGTENTQIDHIKPKAEGGTDKKSNLQVVHSTCHQQKTAIERRSRSIKRKNEKKAKRIQK